jgi:hypothetical protein
MVKHKEVGLRKKERKKRMPKTIVADERDSVHTALLTQVLNKVFRQ